MTGRNNTGILLICLLLWMKSSVFGQAVINDGLENPLGDRTPLILIHGFCGSFEATWNHDQGFRKFFDREKSLNSKFKLYPFTYSTGSNVANVRKILDHCSPTENPDHTASRIQTLAIELHRALRDHPEIGSHKPIVILAHSLGGLVARSFLQELRGYRRTLLVITLATPHHGTFLANVVDFAAGNISSLYWDEYDGNRQVFNNEWLRCLNGLPVGNPLVCGSNDLETRRGTFGKIVAFGLARQFSVLDDYPDDGLVPIQSSLFFEATSLIRRRYFGIWREGGAKCGGHDVSAHTTIHYEDCKLEQSPPVGRGLENIFNIVRRELLSSLLRGDLNGDGTVDILDFSYMVSPSVWFTSDPIADLDGNGLVNSLDFSILNGNWHRTIASIE